MKGSLHKELYELTPYLLALPGAMLEQRGLLAFEKLDGGGWRFQLPWEAPPNHICTERTMKFVSINLPILALVRTASE